LPAGSPYFPTSLSNNFLINLRLESFYSNKYGVDNLIIIKDSKQVELSKLNPDKAYIQITFAEPYFDNYGKSD
jgi:hypothetical protein